MFGSRIPTPLSQRSNASLAIGLILAFLWMLIPVGWLGYFLYQCGFCGDALPLLIVWLAVLFFLWIGLGAIWAFSRELRRRKK
jgi:hypothetical protein